MSKTIWSKFFWTAWASDPALRLCSLAAQGMWMRMLCIAAESDPIGYVTVNGRPLDASDLARMTGVTEPEAVALLSELDRNGVFSRDRNGRVYSRRMVRDAKRSAIAQKNGKEGGNPSLCNGNKNFALVKPPDKGGLKPYKLEARSQKERKTPETFVKMEGVAAAAETRSAARATRLQKGWRPSEEQAAYARTRGFYPHEIERVILDFHDYWVAKSGQSGTKLDWNATWQKWVRAEADKLKRPVLQRSAESSGFYAKFGSGELEAWDAYGRRTRGSSYPRDKAGGWRFPTQWPPEGNAIKDLLQDASVT